MLADPGSGEGPPFWLVDGRFLAMSLCGLSWVCAGRGGERQGGKEGGRTLLSLPLLSLKDTDLTMRAPPL